MHGFAVESSMSYMARTMTTFIVLFALAGGAAEEKAIDFRPVGGFLKLTEEAKLGPCSGCDIDRNVWVIQRQSPPVLGFDAAGKLLRSWGTPLIGLDPDMRGAHGIRIDKDDCVWITDRARHLVRKFDPAGWNAIRPARVKVP
jgi:hypothetical protein